MVSFALDRGRIGDPAALVSGRMLAAGVGNPALAPLLGGVGAGA